MLMKNCLLVAKKVDIIRAKRNLVVLVSEHPNPLVKDWGVWDFNVESLITYFEIVMSIFSGFYSKFLLKLIQNKQ